ncbi:MAG TPA: hypothetical protein VN703_07495 [Candidatus Sulfopaludibacter sp.]|nr:hypothetical protein [Candidatus Sulfopaludibacter sp.]
MDIIQEIKDNLPIDIIKYIIQPYLKIDDMFECIVSVQFRHPKMEPYIQNHTKEYIFEDIIDPIMNNVIKYRDGCNINPITIHYNRSDIFNRVTRILRSKRIMNGRINKNKSEIELYVGNLINVGYYEMIYLNHYKKNKKYNYVNYEINVNTKKQKIII